MTIAGGTSEQWQAVAERVMRGEFRGCDGSTKESLLYGLRATEQTTRVRQATLRLEEQGDAEPVAKVRQPARKQKPRRAETGTMI